MPGGGTGEQPLGAYLQAAPLAGAVAARVEPAERGGDVGEMLARLIDKRRDVLPLERVRRPLRVVLVVGGRRRGDDPVEVAAECTKPGLGALMRRREQRARRRAFATGIPLRHSHPNWAGPRGIPAGSSGATRNPGARGGRSSGTLVPWRRHSP